MFVCKTRALVMPRLKALRMVTNDQPSVQNKNAKNSVDKQQDVSAITPRAQDYSAWYNDVITSADMVDQSPVRGCMVIKPWGMGIWDRMHIELDERIKG